MLDVFTAPLEYAYFRSALAACISLSLSFTSLGGYIVLRRMSLMGDALSHSALPGVAIGYAVAGLSLPAMSIGGFLAGLVVALVSGYVSRSTILKEDATLVSFYLIALALGVLIVTKTGSNIDLMHIMLGNPLAVDQHALIFIGTVSSLTLVLLAIIYRPLTLECFDPEFMRSLGWRGGRYYAIFIVLVVANLISAIHALGTLMALGLMMLPAVAARFWVHHLGRYLMLGSLLSVFASIGGLYLSHWFSLPTGAAIITMAGLTYVVSLVIHMQRRLYA
ncbi:MAG: metal ABC transporter permease [Alphaproteobacteria bacterium]|nr:MAG: metal ABC transporter permease [Alphaproteobacteria bacterium]